MKLSDDQLRAGLERRAGGSPWPDLVGVARRVTATPQRRGTAGRRQIIALVGAAASIVVAASLLGSLVLRPSPPSSHPPASGSDPPSAAASSRPVESTPAPVAWASLVWRKGDPAPFAFDGNAFVQDAIPDGAGFIAVGYSTVDDGITGRIWRTTDGRSWRLVEGDWFSNAQFDQILSVGSGAVIVGAHRQAGPMTPAIWSSSDGRSWEERTPEDIEDLFIAIAAGGPDGLLLSATDRDGHRFWLRADADFRWERLAVSWPDDVGISGIASGGPGWIASGVTGIDTGGSTGGTSKGAIWTSPDGATWTPATIAQPGGTMSNVARVLGGFVATGSDGNVACTVCLGPITFNPLVTWFSSDGLSWRRTGEFQPSIGTRVAGTFAANDGQRMQVFGSGVDRRLMISETLDGVHWQEIAMWHEAGMSAADVEAFPNFRVIFVGNSGLIAFGDESSGESGVPVSPVPWSASVSQPVPPNAATFPPRPEPSLSDVPCPNQEPCGP